MKPIDQSEQNGVLIRRLHEKLNEGDWRAAAEDYAADGLNFGRPGGRAQILLILEDICTTFPDWRMEITDMLTDADQVAVGCRVSGTHLGMGKLPINGGMLVGVPPTGKRFEVRHMHWYKLNQNQIVDHMGVRDDLGMMVQLGLLSGP